MVVLLYLVKFISQNPLLAETGLQQTQPNCSLGAAAVPDVIFCKGRLAQPYRGFAATSLTNVFFSIPIREKKKETKPFTLKWQGQLDICTVLPRGYVNSALFHAVVGRVPDWLDSL